MILKFLSKFSVPTQAPQKNNLITTLYPTLSPEAASRTSTNRFSIMSTSSTAESEMNSWSSSSFDESFNPINEIKEVIPLISINGEQEIHRIAYKILQQCIDLLRCLPSDDEYVYESKFLPSSTIGKHVRHLYDHFRLLLESKQLNAKRDYDDHEEPKEDNSKSWTVNYDNRPKNIAMETLRLTAVEQLELLQATIVNDCTFISLNTPVQIDATVDSEMLIGPIPFQSTYGRELWFCCHHAIHHFALIRVICTEQSIVVPEDFGVAPSTLKKQSEFEHAVKKD